MKKYLLLTLACVVFLTACNGSKEPYQSPASEELSGTHILRRFAAREVTTTSSHSSGGFFLVFGGYSSNSTTTQQIKVKFAWLNNEGEYVLSELPINKIRVKVDSTINTPYVKFKWTERSFMYDIEDPMSPVIYMVVTCKEEDFPINIDINSL